MVFPVAGFMTIGYSVLCECLMGFCLFLRMLMAELQMLPLDGQWPLVHLSLLPLLWSRNTKVIFLGSEVGPSPVITCYFGLVNSN